MSLLLDALKKAAKDKQARAGDDDGQKDTAEQNKDTVRAEEPEAFEFTIDEEKTEPQAPLKTADGHNDSDDTDGETVEPPMQIEPDDSESANTVSDDALQLLIYKANREHRRRQKVIWTSLASSFFVVLIVGAWYFYTGMIQDVEALERKHKIAMRSVHEHEVKVRTPVAQEPAQTATTEKNIQPVKKPSPPSASTASANTGNKPVKKVAGGQAQPIEINRGSRQNPISGWLNEGYTAYKNGDYTTAREAYSQVLNREANNRDALLGLGAIAVKTSDAERAKFAYQRLLKLDPRDPIANAALANLDAVSRGNLTESKIKFLLQQQPDAPHLHYALGNIYAKNQKWPEAQQSYFIAWQGDSANADYAFNLAVSLDRIGKVDQAKRFYQSCLLLAKGQNISFSVSAVEQRLNQLAAGADRS